MSRTPAEQAPTTTAGALPPALPSDLAVAAQVAQQMLTDYAHVDHGDLFALNQAHGAIREALRIVLRAVGVEPDEAVTGSRNPADLGERCPAAHPEDPTPCDGPPVVTFLDSTNAGAKGCEHHGARFLASITGGRVYALPDAPDGAAIRVFKASAYIHPFPWLESAPRTRPEQRSHAENRARGEAE
ncbi:hypothetical protein BJ965_001068 [Streptomyces luteogriseus]|uniref:Uncharacterized protein n=1 Tax=Streptomyces luteogriseus TaxID=68233 RepID=A0A7W7DI46_9ACTN|nr:hypothetical protein [Streptomyces luteogriseus]MBB4711186.1 hypothetical protein [Streptomyces luteogriseus]